MSGYGLIAVLLIRLDARAGEWVNVLDLARHINADPEQVRAALEGLLDSGVQLQRVDGQVVQAGIFHGEAASCA